MSQSKPVRRSPEGRKKIVLSDREIADLYQLAIGAYAPLKGFMEEKDYLSVVESLRLSDGQPWPIPITLGLSEGQAQSLRPDQPVILTGEDGRIHGTIRVTSLYRPNRTREAERVFGTSDVRHPGVNGLRQSGPVYIGGPVEIGAHPELVGGFEWIPWRVKEEFDRRGWRRVVAFQTRNPIHRAHEYIQKCALETVDGLFIHPLIGPTKADDVPADVRIRTYQTVINRWYRKDRVLLAAYTGPMRYAGPREAILHALVRRNYGCTHFIVGRNHAGVGNYYGPYDAHRLFEQFDPGELGITPLYFEDAFYCYRCQGMTSNKGCPHDMEDRVILSGTEVRRFLERGRSLPTEFTRPEVAEILQDHYRSRSKQLGKGYDG